jgi:hypothetical protein
MNDQVILGRKKVQVLDLRGKTRKAMRQIDQFDRFWPLLVVLVLSLVSGLALVLLPVGMVWGLILLLKRARNKFVTSRGSSIQSE